MQELERDGERKRALYKLSGDNELVALYFKRRACDIARYGLRVADRTFPQPTVRGVRPGQVAEMVAWLAKQLEEVGKRAEEKKHR